MPKPAILSVVSILGLLVLATVAAQAQTAPAQAPSPQQRGRSSSGEGLQPAADAKVLAAPSPPTGQATRYVIPYYTSQTTQPPGSRSTTMVDVYNQSSISCDVSVQFQYAFGTTNTCSINLTIPPKQSRLFCSRTVNDPLFPCTISCPGAGLTFNTGHAFVSSTNDNNLECARIAIHAQLAFTRDAADDQVEGTTRLSVIEINQGNNGD